MAGDGRWVMVFVSYDGTGMNLLWELDKEENLAITCVSVDAPTPPLSYES